LVARLDLEQLARNGLRYELLKIESKVAFSPSPSERPENNGFTPIIGPGGVTGSTSLRSTARPPASAMRTVSCASSGRDEAGCFSIERLNFALPSLSVVGRLSSDCRALSTFSSPRPNW